MLKFDEVKAKDVIAVKQQQSSETGEWWRTATVVALDGPSLVVRYFDYPAVEFLIEPHVQIKWPQRNRKNKYTVSGSNRTVF